MSTTTPPVTSRSFDPDSIGFDDFEISWVGANPIGDGYGFGSEDGRFLTSTSIGIGSPIRLARSGEAINGLARANNTIAVSTRCDISLHDLTFPLGEGEVGVYPGGAHGVLATSSGGFVAPLGFNGLLRIPSPDAPAIRMFVNKINGESINLYKINALSGDGDTDIIICAARRHGLMTFKMIANKDGGRPASSPYYRAPGMDLVDVCPIGTPEWPFAVAALGDEGSIHLFRDIVAQTPPITFRPSILQGSGYSLLHFKGNIFLLTSEAFYSFPNLATRFLSNDLGHVPEFFRSIQAVEAYIIDDRLLLVLPDRTLDIPLSSTFTEETGSRSSSSSKLTAEVSNLRWSSTDLSWSSMAVA